MHFGENQLSPGLIGLSPRPTVHPSFLQQTSVRASSEFYFTFTLTMGRSPGFGSTDCNSFALLRLGFPAASSLKDLTSLQSVTRRLINQKARHHSIAAALTACRHTVSGSISLPSPGFFSPFPHGTGSLSVIRRYLALEDGPPRFPQGFTCLVVLSIPLEPQSISHTGLSPSTVALSRAFCYESRSHIEVLQPRPQHKTHSKK
jgi:hypothetical protein